MWVWVWLWAWTASVRVIHSEVILGPQLAAEMPLQRGEALLAELNCLACHEDSAVRAYLGGLRPGPRLGAAGLRWAPQALQAWLADPHREKPGTLMPDLLRGYPEAERAQTAEWLTHYLVSIQPARSNAVVGADSHWHERGRQLYHRVGCVACHAPFETVAALGEPASGVAGDAASAGSKMPAWATTSVPLGPLARRYEVGELARFLANPLEAHPGGRMPGLGLSEEEARAIAMYLLEEQARPAPGVERPRIPGLSYRVFEGEFRKLEQMQDAAVRHSGIVDRFLTTPRHRPQNVGIRFSGFLRIAADGLYRFETASDDGSRLYVDGRLVVDNDGEHGEERREGRVELKAGEHPILAEWANVGGDGELRVFYEGPGVERQEIPGNVLTTQEGVAMRPVGQVAFVVDAEKARRGGEAFARLGCAACHDVGGGSGGGDGVGPGRGPALASLRAAAPGGCLDETPRAGAVRYDLSAAQRADLRAVLGRLESVRGVRNDADAVMHLLARFNCVACHVRDGVGGPVAARAEYYRTVGEVDMGDEGRLPPHLGGVGGKLQLEAVRAMLAGQGGVRPYMATRMPMFGVANVGQLADLLARLDVSSTPAPEPRSGEDAKWGRKLAGTGGFACIACHGHGGLKSLGIPAVDLATMGGRLRPDWFRRYLLDPQALRPGTRMPQFFPQGVSVRTDVLDGSAERQIGALWAYLRLGSEGGPPPGLIQGRMELVAEERPVIYRNFIRGAGTRAIGVGYPEKANLAFDANQGRIALLWQGPFIDAAVHRTGRGEGFADPLGYNVVSFPPGPGFALLPFEAAPWPSATERSAGYRMEGYSLDAQGRPAFEYALGGVRIEDRFQPVSGDAEAHFVRTLTVRSVRPVAGLWFRAWVGREIVAEADGSYVVGGKLRLAFVLPTGTQPVLRAAGESRELIVPVRLEGGEARLVEVLQW